MMTVRSDGTIKLGPIATAFLSAFAVAFFGLTAFLVNSLLDLKTGQAVASVKIDQLSKDIKSLQDWRDSTNTASRKLGP